MKHAMDFDSGSIDETLEAHEHKLRALRVILDAWSDAIGEGLAADAVANAALFAALADLVAAYGEDAVATMTDGLSERIQLGEFSVRQTRH